jgi:hypothetical protein
VPPTQMPRFFDAAILSLMRSPVTSRSNHHGSRRRARALDRSHLLPERTRRSTRRAAERHEGFWRQITQNLGLAAIGNQPRQKRFWQGRRRGATKEVAPAQPQGVEVEIGQTSDLDRDIGGSHARRDCVAAQRHHARLQRGAARCASGGVGIAMR